jgi:hypothetical protein
MAVMRTAWACVRSVFVAASELVTPASVPFAARSELWTVMRACGGAALKVMSALPISPIAPWAALTLSVVDLTAAEAVASLRA